LTNKRASKKLNEECIGNEMGMGKKGVANRHALKNGNQQAQIKSSTASIEKVSPAKETKKPVHTKPNPGKGWEKKFNKTKKTN